MAIADQSRNRILYVPATSGTYFGQSMTAGYVYNIAGTGTAGYDAASDTNAAAATTYKTNGPEAVAIDSAGNVVFADTTNDRIRIIFKSTCSSSCPFGAAATTAGYSRTIAGNGTNGYSGDTGAATSATMRVPKGLVFDSVGNLLISDSGNNRVRMVFKTTCASSCGYGLSAGTANSIYLIVGDGTSAYLDATPATGGRISVAQAIAVDSSNNLYITDTGNNRIRKVLRSNGAMSLFAGNATSGTAGDDGPANDAAARISSMTQGIAVDLSTDNVYFSDTSSDKIRMVAQKTGSYPQTFHGVTFSASNEMDTVAGMGTAGAPTEGYPANDEAGTSATSARVQSPRGLTVVNGVMYIADSANYSIRKVTATNRMYTVAGSNVSGATFGVPGQRSGLVNPAAVAADSSGNLYVADAGDHRIRKYDVASGEWWTIAGTGTGGITGDGGTALAARVNAPEGIALNSAGTVLYIGDTANNRVRALCLSGSCTVLGVSIATGVLSTLVNTTVTAGTCANGTDADTTGCKLSAPKGVAVNSNGDLAVADSGNHKIMYFPATNIGTRYNVSMTTAGAGYTVVGTGATGFNDNVVGTSAQLATPSGVAMDSSSNLFIGDTSNNRIRRTVASGGTTSTVAGSGTAGNDGDGAAATSAKISGPTHLAIDGSVVYFQSANAYIRKFTVGSNISTIAGTGSTGYSGDGGGATAAAIYAAGIAQDPTSDAVWLCGGTTTNTQVRKITGPV
jgi:trimeric autotransporter adhesin